ncbi:MAG: four helix bundle suffix domain-containing protein, partial [Paludibacteraceae bacterium]|nr:four helix bundle suffix domain-containing protein [Paludibacteraceae bacterium]
TRPPETIANMCIVLIKQADYLLYKQLQRLSDDFMQNGGFSERMFRLRSQQREPQDLRGKRDSRDSKDLKDPRVTK